MTTGFIEARSLFSHLSRRTLKVAGVLVGIHGIAHLVGTSGTFQAAANGEVEEYLGGFWEISDPWLLRTVGVAWALLALAFLVAAGLMWIGHKSWAAVLGYTAAASLIMTVIGLVPAVVGVIVNLGLFGFAKAAEPAHVR
jgi:hypothetical protein